MVQVVLAWWVGWYLARYNLCVCLYIMVYPFFHVFIYLTAIELLLDASSGLGFWTAWPLPRQEGCQHWTSHSAPLIAPLPIKGSVYGPNHLDPGNSYRD